MTDVMRDVDFKVFAAAATAPGSRVVALRVPGGAEMSRSEIDAYTQFVGIYGARAWPTSRSTKWPRAATACNRPSSRTCMTPRWPS